jgi:hypothetical protein
MRADTATFKRQLERNKMANATAWAAGCYVWAILDAIEKSGRFVNDEPRNPRLAGWLSAIPGLGLGQWYNGKLSKAGMVMAVQASLAVISFNYQSQYAECGRQLQRIEDARRVECRIDEASGYAYSRDWDAVRRESFRSRNTYLWYSIFFYFYGIFDAVVDAHLHDYRTRMKLEPDLDIPAEKVGMRLSIDMRPYGRGLDSPGAEPWR